MKAHLLLTALATLAACGTPMDEVAPDATEAPLPDDAMFTQTSVVFIDGQPHVLGTRPLSVAQARRDNAAREAGPRGLDQLFTYFDPWCQNDALWMYDRADRTGNRICFLGAGLANLAEYPRYDGGWTTWQIGAGATWPGAAGGRLFTVNDDGIDASYAGVPPGAPYQQLWWFSAWAPATPFYGLVPYEYVQLW